MGRITKVIAGWALGLSALASCEDKEQPIAFPHAKHVALKMECVSCHTGARDQTHAGIPWIHSCTPCHRLDRPFPKTPPELLEYINAVKEIPWLQVHRAPRHVYFSHRRHVAVAGIDCAECHGDVQSMDRPFSRPMFPAGQAGMDRCIDCHRKERVTTDCLACHR
ncbi:MAG: cytochrome c3 family protein [Planctomycetes bacterium]|nr:cytochrome c3 family protein [Planctomycetota bacterium]